MVVTLGFAGPVDPDYVFVGGKPDAASLDAMPRIADLFLDSSIFLFRTKAEAEKRAKFGGSGFLVGKEIEGSAERSGHSVYAIYLVSNRHVVFDGAASVASVNRLDGGPPDPIETEPTDWVAHPGGDDLAAICMMGLIKKNIHKVRLVQQHLFVTKQLISDFDIGIGDDVFMVGRFVNHQGGSTNRASARFGSISMMQENIWVKEHHRHQESFAVEMRSRTGFSGSPVAIYRTPSTVLTQVPAESFGMLRLLGVNWGYIIDEDGENTWLNGVVPAWKITELLETPALKKRHKELGASYHQHMDSRGATSNLAFAGEPDPVATDENPKHREDFTSLLNAAAQKPKQDGQT
jgi:hypothetical protein